MDYKHFTFSELQSWGIAGDQGALLELGKRVLDMPTEYDGRDHHCQYKDELEDLRDELDREVPPDCPHCGKWITDL